LKILFVTVGKLAQGRAGLTSTLASARYRAIIPAEQLSRRGHEVDVRSSGPGEWSREIVDFPCDVVVVSKSLARANEAHLAEMKARGVKAVVDICDNVFGDAEYGEHFRALARLADVVTSSSAAMAEAIRRETGRDSIVVVEPVEGARGIPRFAPSLPIRMLWFGNPLSIEGVAERTRDLVRLSEAIPVSLTLITLPSPQLKKVFAELRALNPGRLAARFVPWSLETTWRALEACDAVWIPVATGDFHRTKSPNRLVESLWAGRLAVTDAVESYLPFVPAAAVGQRLDEAIVEALRDTGAVQARIAVAQRDLATHHSPYACGLGWAAALGEQATPATRLSIGCTHGLLDGYVNIDDATGVGVRPDVLCDPGDLSPFADDSIEELVARRVLERHRPSAVPPLVREWLRVLARGGRMAVECGDLLGACRALLEDVEPGDSTHAALNVLYGDPEASGRDATYRWAYTPRTLAALLAREGLVDVRSEASTTGPYAMRVVGIKS
jgi:hypothetical protein